MGGHAVLERPVDRAAIDDAEWALRVQLAAAYRLVDYFGWTEQIYGHLTARVPGPDDHFLINPWGLNYDEVTASNLVKIDVDGNIVLDNGHPINYAGFVIHSAIHMTRSEENHVVMHPKTPVQINASMRQRASSLGCSILRRSILSRSMAGVSPADALLCKKLCLCSEFVAEPSTRHGQYIGAYPFGPE